MTVKVDDKVICSPNGKFKNSFVGIVEKLYTRSAMVKIIEFHPDDRWQAIKLSEKTIVAFDNIESESISENAEIRAAM
ncbi:hypothetical protein [Secundilactobacillus malefermentans]|uniref:DUF2187 domain-containing protein n=1 Tax=Secundilactobacillus malefermentans TaxID=176292 RepID=A0A4R5NT98_9LACO|nr:hypothetical protein [Secundilactobacillus malefermentans]QEA32256.1 hypothetical protein FGL90_08775 [Secundilactobacillus malefermentans]TDG80532.1 hypothetical protein C5L31_001559 [Secundilactobacillus malefermentans]